MKHTSTRTYGLAVLGLLGFTLNSQAAELLDAGPMVASVGQHHAARDEWRTLIGLVDNGSYATKNTITLVGDANNPADYRLDSTAGGNTTFGQYTNWSGVTTNWIRIDLGADYELDSMAFFNMAVSSGGNSNRGINQGDIYYRTEAQGPGSNTNNDGVAFDNTGWTILGTAGTQTFTQTTGGDTAIQPDVIDFGGATARYVAIDVNTTHGGTSCGIAELMFFKEGVESDPVLALDGGTTDPDFNFGTVFEGAAPAPTRSVTFVNNSPSTAETITIDSVTLTDDAGGAFAPPVVTYSGTNVLANGDTVTIDVPLTYDEAGNHAGNLEILTTSSGGIVAADFNDKNLALTATVYQSGEVLNPNPFLEAGLADWDLPGGSDAPVAVSPGLAAGSNGMARVPGVGDPITGASGDLTHPASFMQSNQLPDGASNWQLTAFFTPINAANFASYADADGTLGLSGADGAFTDRTFQLLVRATDTGRPFPEFGNTQVPNTMINIAYMPAGIQTSATPDFYVFNGSTGLWEATGIGAIVGSTDNDTDGDPLTGTGDGLLDTSVDPLDVINSYRIIVTGTGFGEAGASYDITVYKTSGTDSFVSGTATGLTAFHGTSGETGTPAGYAFITSDVSDATDGSNKGDGTDGGFTTPFWVDDVSFFNVAGPDPSLATLSEPDTILVASPDTTGSTSFIIRNDGTLTDLEDVALSISGGATGFSVTSPAGTFDLSPTAIQQVDILWDSASASDSSEAAVLTISGTNFDPIELPLLAGVLTEYANVLGNWDFETAGTDAAGDTDTFAVWEEDFAQEDDGSTPIDPTAVTDVAGLITPGTAAAISAGSTSVTPARLTQALSVPSLNNFVMEFDFSVPYVGRDLYFFLESAYGGRVNISYNTGTNSFRVYDNVVSATGWYEVIPAITLTAGTPYQLKVTGANWGTSNPTVSLELFDAGGNPLASSGAFSHAQNEPIRGGLDRVMFTNRYGGSGGCSIDEIVLSGSSIDDVPTSSFGVTDFTIDPATGVGSVTFGPTGTGETYYLEGSDDLGVLNPFEQVGEGIDGAGKTTTVPFVDPAAVGNPARFYRVTD